MPGAARHTSCRRTWRGVVVHYACSFIDIVLSDVTLLIDTLYSTALPRAAAGHQGRRPGTRPFDSHRSAHRPRGRTDYTSTRLVLPGTRRVQRARNPARRYLNIPCASDPVCNASPVYTFHPPKRGVPSPQIAPNGNAERPHADSCLSVPVTFVSQPCSRLFHVEHWPTRQPVIPSSRRRRASQSLCSALP